MGLREVLDRLRAGGMLRRAVEPDPDVLLELAKTAAKDWKCEQCQATGLVFRTIQDDPGTWDDTHICEACRKVIPPERMVLFPQSTLCASCQRIVESGQSPVAEYCEKCGSILQIRATKTAGISRYTMFCPACRR